jgi:hypothetical protein
MDIAIWLRNLGLEQYAQTFSDNASTAPHPDSTYWADLDWCCEWQVWGMKSGSRRQG